MNPQTLSTIFRFDRRWIYDDYDDIENKGIYIFLREITSPLRRSYDTSSLTYSAFHYALKSVAVEFLASDNDNGTASLEGFFDKVQERVREITQDQMLVLWQYFFRGKLIFNSEKEEYAGSRGRTISESMFEDVICGSLELVTEVELEKIRIYLKHAVSKSEWYQFYGANLTDSESLEEIDNRIARIL